ncbi:MAG TPA: type II toxin-antitoxin system PemK/MazF family toxin [Caulobacteraceae bacterium]|jgi:mRNA interferase MazF|nr:type II toxin-antitoxin system PemK/MazF family toxin [Caulobacteraceae bacterium]
MPSKAGAGGAQAPAKPQALSFGAIVLVRFPFTSQAASKQRPAVIVSSRAYNLERPDLIMMPVTSQLRPTPALGEVWLRQWQAAGLIKPSAVKPVIATLELRLVIRRLGALADEDQDALRAAISQIIG